VQALDGLDDGLAKVWLVSRALAARARLPQAFGLDGGYRALYADGARAEHVVAFARGDDALVVAPRLVSHLGHPNADWSDTTIDLPHGKWRDELAEAGRAGGRVRVGELLAQFPMALLVRATDD
jgi:(1->4)-alpha-D-glucan 1-alpha-D-glucosylmutase